MHIDITALAIIQKARGIFLVGENSEVAVAISLKVNIVAGGSTGRIRAKLGVSGRASHAQWT